MYIIFKIKFFMMNETRVFAFEYHTIATRKEYMWLFSKLN